jgi:transposase-like protein
MPTMPKPYPREFRENVVAVARQGEEGIAQIAKDFGIAESCLRNWLSAADAEDGKGGGPKAQESEQLRELKRRNRLLEQENEVLRRAAAYLSQGINPK